MMNDMSSFEQIDFGGVPYQYSSSKGFDSGKGGNFHGTEDWRDSRDGDLFSSSFGFYEDNIVEDQLDQQIPLYSDFGVLEDDLFFNSLSPPIQPYQEEIEKLACIQVDNLEPVETKKEKPNPFPLASLGILKSYGNGFKRLNGEKINVPRDNTTSTTVGGRRLSTEEIMRLAGEKFIQSTSEGIDDTSMLSHPYESSLLGLSDEQNEDVELAQYLLLSAEKAGQQQFDRATKLLNRCDNLSSSSGNPVQRVVYYFSKALRERINRETGSTSKGFAAELPIDIDEAIMSLNPALLASHESIPFFQVGQLTGMQAIIENVTNAKRIHIIDIEIRNGVQWIILMQALAARYDCPVELLKITAIGTKSIQKIEDTGKYLMGFAESLNLPFSFKVVEVSDMLHLKEELFDLDPKETTAVFADYCLRTMICQPNQLESLMRVIRNINPCVMVVIEIEASHNSLVFGNRFIETLFYFSAYFDCLEDCMGRKDPNRMIFESLYLDHGIQNIVVAEGNERTIRHVKIEVWRTFFERFGMKETELSTSSLYQASLVVKKFACRYSCSLRLDGKCLLVGWKGTPIFSLSAWKFS